MELTLQRGIPTPHSTPGELSIDGVHECVTLERAPDDREHPCIRAGRYRVVVTSSARAKAGTLYTPRADFGLPLLLDVPGRTGIRVHAANHPKDISGCIGVGQVRSAVPDEILHARDALDALLLTLEMGLSDGEVFILVADAS